MIFLKFVQKYEFDFSFGLHSYSFFIKKKIPIFAPRFLNEFNNQLTAEAAANS